MGTEIIRDEFDEREYARFRERLEQDLSELRRLLGRPGFGVGPVTIGAELELFLIEGAAQPLPLNQAIRAEAADPQITVEVNRFNLELNSAPTPLAGRPFAADTDGDLSVDGHVFLSDHRDRARGIAGGVPAHRAERHSRETTDPAGPHHEHGRVSALLATAIRGGPESSSVVVGRPGATSSARTTAASSARAAMPRSATATVVGVA
jgi:hypothetical protein